MRNPANPPAKHILRPHHVNLLSIIVLAFGTFEGTPDGPLPAPFLLHLYRILIRELSEVRLILYMPYMCLNICRSWSPKASAILRQRS